MAIKRRWALADWSDWPNWPGLWTTFKENWYLGFTSFGGPGVHFKIFRDKFVTELQWIDEQMYQELFSVCQAFSGPGSTKMLYCINLIHDGFLSAVLAFLLWSLPGALGMFGLAIGVSNISETLPRAVYALLSGLNAATVGIIALAAVQLAQKAITDKLTRLLVFLGAAAGLLYNALWYFPVLMLAAGVTAVVYDLRWLHGPVGAVAGLPGRVGLWGKGRKGRKRRAGEHEPEAERGGGEDDEMEMTSRQQRQQQTTTTTITPPPPTKTTTTITDNTRQRLPITNQDTAPPSPHHPSPSSPSDPEPRTIPPSHRLPLTWKPGVAIIAAFLVALAVILAVRGALAARADDNNSSSSSGGGPMLYRLFANLFLAGTIIFGGGPVVIPLLREYVVAEGWVAARDFLIGLALAQGFPGPNFNFAVYLGALAAAGSSSSGSHAAAAAAGAVLAFMGVFAPGLVTVHGTVGVWGAIRGRREVRSALRGVNAAAVGLIYTAVYRLWQIGWIDEGFERGASLAGDPWWVVVTATSYVGGCWFGVSPPLACVLGAVLGLVRYAVVQA